jgi:hypothetical protein
MFLYHIPVFSQEVELPIEENKILFRYFINTQKVKEADSISERIYLWCKNNNISILNWKKDSSVKNLLSFRCIFQLNDTKNNNGDSLVGVKYEFTLNVTTIDGVYRLEALDFLFDKDGARYDVSEIYFSVKKKKPFIKALHEKPAIALARHKNLLNLFKNQFLNKIDSLKESVDTE